MLRRAIAVIGVAAALTLTSVNSAFANIWGSVDCGQSPTPDCQLGAGKGGGAGTPGGIPGGTTPGPGSSRSGGGSGGNNGPSGDVILGGNPNLANCSYTPSNYQPPTGATPTAWTRRLAPGGVTVQPAVLLLPAAAGGAVPVRPAASPTPGQSGTWYVWKCTTPGLANAFYRPPVWIPNPPQPGAAGPSPAELAQMARQQLRLIAPRIAVNPAGEQLVNLPTWLWLSGGWAPISATASVPGVSVTAVAAPTSVDWSMGDGSVVPCPGSGTPFVPGTDTRASSPDCGYTYRTSSASQPNQAFAVTATVHWRVSWSGAGQTGVFPDLTTSATAALRVAESQALNTGTG